MNEFLGGRGTDAPDNESDEDDDVSVARQSVTNDDIFSKGLLETSDVEVCWNANKIYQTIVKPHKQIPLFSSRSKNNLFRLKIRRDTGKTNYANAKFVGDEFVKNQR